MGVIQILKSNNNVSQKLQSTLDMKRDPGAFLSPVNIGGTQYQRLSDAGTVDYDPFIKERTSGQCVAFARSMTGAPKVAKWNKGFSISSYIEPISQRLLKSPELILQGGIPLQAGTMLANFQGKPTYPTSKPYGHVTIFLEWTFNPLIPGKVTGMNVVDENMVESIKESTGNFGGTIQKHWLPITCTAGSKCGTSVYLSTFFADMYNVVDIH